MASASQPAPTIKVATEVWIATALLHRENPDREDFTITEIVRRATQESLHETLRPGVQVHASVHCVANKEPNPAIHRMLFATGLHTRRLYRPGDPVSAGRTGKTIPDRNDVPEGYRYLLEWYSQEWAVGPPTRQDPILGLAGAGADLWDGEEDVDEYVRGLREGWL